MARIFKPTYTDRAGLRREGRKWAVEFRDHTPRTRPRRLTAFTDKRASEELLRGIEQLVALRASSSALDQALTRWIERIPEPIKRRLGQWDLIDPERVGPTKGLACHIADFEAKMCADGCGEGHVRETIGLIRRMFRVCRFETTGDIRADAVNRFVNDLRLSDLSTRRINAYLTAAKAFTRWMTMHARLPADPLTSIRKGNVKTDRRHERRAFTLEEFQWLRAVTTSGPTRYRMTGAERGLLYTIAAHTGLRANELRSLTACSFNLDASSPTVKCRAKAAKNAKDAYQHLPAPTADELRNHLRTRPPTGQAFQMPHTSDLAEMIRADEADGRRAWIDAAPSPEERATRMESRFLAYEDRQGRKLDFHALRYTTGAWLANAGVHPKRIQHLMRHSSITLTMDTYGHLFPGDEAETVRHFPDLGPPASNGRLAPIGGGEDSTPDARLALCLALQDGSSETRVDSDGLTTPAGGPETPFSEGRGRIRTDDGLSPTDLQSAPLVHSGTRPAAFDSGGFYRVDAGGSRMPVRRSPRTARCRLPAAPDYRSHEMPRSFSGQG